MVNRKRHITPKRVRVGLKIRSALQVCTVRVKLPVPVPLTTLTPYSAESVNLHFHKSKIENYVYAPCLFSVNFVFLTNPAHGIFRPSPPSNSGIKDDGLCIYVLNVKSHFLFQDIVLGFKFADV